MGPLKRSLCGRNGLFGEEHAQHTTVILERRRVFDMIVHYLYDSCYLFCGVSREARHMCLFQHEALQAYGLSFGRGLRDACTGLSSLDTVNVVCSSDWEGLAEQAEMIHFSPVIWLWWKMSGYVDTDLQVHVASSTIHLPPNLKVLAGCVHFSMVLSSSHSPSPIFH